MHITPLCRSAPQWDSNNVAAVERASYSYGGKGKAYYPPVLLMRLARNAW